jgi:hypothetical protein
MPRSGASRVVRVFADQRSSPTSTATSVKVPPMSAPTRAIGKAALPSNRSVVHVAACAHGDRRARTGARVQTTDGKV